MSNTQMDNDINHTPTEGRSLIAAAKRLSGKAQQGRKSESRFRQRAGSGPEQQTRAFTDGYVRRSPVQQVKEKPDYRRKRTMKAVQIVLFMAVLVALIYLALQTGLLSF